MFFQDLYLCEALNYVSPEILKFSTVELSYELIMALGDIIYRRYNIKKMSVCLSN